MGVRRLPIVKPEEFGWTEFSWNRNGGGAMARTRYAPDRGLIARMGLTIFLLGAVFVAFILALVLILSASHRASGAAIVVFPVLLALGLGFGSYYWSDKIALRSAGASLSPRRARRRRPRCQARGTGTGAGTTATTAA